MDHFDETSLVESELVEILLSRDEHKRRKNESRPYEIVTDDVVGR